MKHHSLFLALTSVLVLSNGCYSSSVSIRSMFSNTKLSDSNPTGTRDYISTHRSKPTAMGFSSYDEYKESVFFAYNYLKPIDSGVFKNGNEIVCVVFHLSSDDRNISIDSYHFVEKTLVFNITLSFNTNGGVLDYITNYFVFSLIRLEENIDIINCAIAINNLLDPLGGRSSYYNNRTTV